jgi:hypothetical protein
MSNFPFPLRMAAEREAIRVDRAAAALIPVLVWDVMAVRMAEAAETETGVAETEVAVETEVRLAGGGLFLPMSSHS